MCFTAMRHTHIIRVEYYYISLAIIHGKEVERSRSQRYEKIVFLYGKATKQKFQFAARNEVFMQEEKVI